MSKREIKHPDRASPAALSGLLCRGGSRWLGLRQRARATGHEDRESCRGEH